MYAWVPMPHDGETLLFPNGDVNTKLLEDLLDDAVNMDPKKKIPVFRRIRVSAGDFPTYAEITQKMSVAALRRLYRQETGRDYSGKEPINHSVPVIMVVGFRNRPGLSSYITDIGS